MSGLAGEAFVAIWHDIAPEGVDEFLDWHHREHMPERLGIPVSTCVMIGDSTWDQAAAKDAGAAFIGVPVSSTAFSADVPVAEGLLAAIAAARA